MAPNAASDPSMGTQIQQIINDVPPPFRACDRVTGESFGYEPNHDGSYKMTNAPTNTSNRDRRIQFDLLPERVVELDQLMTFCDLKTRKDLFDNAMTLFEWAVEEVRKGNQIAAYDRKNDHVEIVRLPVLDNAARRALSTKTIALIRTREDKTSSTTEDNQSLVTKRELSTHI
jgi:hypothetical protein